MLYPVLLTGIAQSNGNRLSLLPIHPVAGKPFAVLAAIVDNQNRLIEVDGDFQLQWSGHNYVNPSKPNSHATLEGEPGWVKIQDGLALIPGVRYDEVGVIQLTGMARIRIRKDDKDDKKKKDDDDDKTHTEVIITNSEPFIVQPYDFKITVIANAVSKKGEITAGDPFSLIITPINAFGKTLDHFAQTLSNDNTISLFSRITTDNQVNSQPVYDAQGSVLELIPTQAFEDGAAAFQHVTFDDAGLLEIQVIVSNYFGLTVAGGFQTVGKFIPYQLQMTIDQPAMSGGVDAQYNYAGQAFYAAVTISAINKKTPPGITQNYQESGTGDLIIALPNNKNQIGELNYSYTQSGMTAGVKVIQVTGSLQFDRVQNPQFIAFDYTYENGDLSVTAWGPETEFRSGRVRFRQQNGVAGENLAIRAEIEHFIDSLWQLNTDEDTLALQRSGMRIQEENLDAEIMGTTRTFYAGRIRGGTDAFMVRLNTVLSPVLFSVGLEPSSPLSFLRTVSETWQIVPEMDETGRRYPIARNVFAYESAE